MRAGFYLEAVAILESMIADRLESRQARKHPDCPEKHEFSTLCRLAEELAGKKSDDSDEAKQVYREAVRWASLRNTCVHELAKLEDGCSLSWDDRYAKVKETAISGLSLFRRLDNQVRRLNKVGSVPGVESPSGVMP
jgi:hypothetical protein